MNYHIVYCERKNRLIKNNKSRKASFDKVIEEIEIGNFFTIVNESKNHPSQICYLVEVDCYPIVVPFNIRNKVIQLITLFPSRRHKWIMIN